MKSLFLFLTILFTCNNLSFCKKIQLAEPNELYSKGKYEEAYNMYQQLVKEGNISEVLYYNLANAAFKTGRYAEAVLNYKKTLRINPQHSDARFNLKVTQQMLTDKKTDVVDTGLSKILHSIRYALNTDAWAALQIMFLFLCFICFVAVYLVRNIHLKKTLFLLSFLWILPATISFGFAQWQYTEIHAPEAVIMNPSVNVLSEPTQNSTTLFILHEGSSVDVLQRKDNWIKISFDDEKVGWIEMSQAALVKIP